MEKNVSAVLEGLNPAQEAAVRCTEGPVLIVAGAGSGKTRVLTSRIAYMIENGADASRILALTFTKKAAAEMKERIAGMVGQYQARKISMGTFHSVFIRFLRCYADSLGFPSDFTIYDTSDSQSLIKNILKDRNLDDKVYKPKDVLSRISRAKNDLVLPRPYSLDTERMNADRNSKMPRIPEIYHEYMTRCRNSGVMDFDDILLYMNILFRDNKAALEEIAGRFDHILVDEYQDTNRSQYLILRNLAMFHKNICVVGDDSQSIYAFRGANVSNILNFSTDYPDAQLFRLEQNYRSTQVIVDAANSLIEKNSNRIRKTCFSKGDRGELIRIMDGYTPDEEGRLIASAVKGRIFSDNAEYGDFAVLYRANSQSRAIEQALRAANIPYVVLAGKSFFDRAEVKDMTAYFKLAVNNNDDESFRRIYNTPVRGIGGVSFAAVEAAAKAEGKSLFAAASGDTLADYGLKSGAIAKLKAFCDMISSLGARAAKEDAYETAKAIAYESGMMTALKADTSVEGQSRLGNVEELLDYVKQVVEEQHNADREDLLAQTEDADVEITDADLPVVRIIDYLESSSLASNVDLASDSEDGDISNKVSLMTIHSAKGLEFPYVFVSGMEENVFPVSSVMILPPELEEERRLFYVAMTRAKKALVLTMSKTRMKNGQTEFHSPSRFVREINPSYIKNPLPDALPGGFEGDFGSYTGSASDGGYGRNGGGYAAGGASGPRSQSAQPGRGYASRGAYGPRGNQPGGYGSRSTGGYAANGAAYTVPKSAAGGGGTRPVSAAQPGRSSGVTPFRKPSAPAPAPLKNFEPSPVSEIREGQRVEHNRFGAGVIVSISGPITDRAALVKFDSFGEKKLLLKYAKLRILQ